MASSHLEGPLLRRSIPFVERWISELTAARLPPASTIPKDLTNNNNNKNKNKKSGKSNTAAAAETNSITSSSMSKCLFIIGKVLSVKAHPESQKLYIEEIDLGEAAGGRRTILSGLQEYITPEEFVNRHVLVIANLEPRKIGGILSEGMVLCASCKQEEGNNNNNTDNNNNNNNTSRRVVLLDIPEGTPVGERVIFEGHEGPHEPILKKKLAKHFEEVAAELKTNAKGEVVWKDLPFRTSHGIITSSIVNGVVS